MMDLDYKNPHLQWRYPALMTSMDIEALSVLAAQIPSRGVAVECGSFLGGSAMCVLDHAPDLAMLWCIDVDWRIDDPGEVHHQSSQHIVDHWQLHDLPNARIFATGYIGNRVNCRMLPLSSPYDLTWWNTAVDLVFEDSSHWNPQLRDNLEFWWQHIKPGGVISGHDYGRNCKDVDATVQQFAADRGLTLCSAANIWWAIKTSA